MAPNASVTFPRWVLVGGAPGAGKTTLAHELGRLIPCPVIVKDEIKAGIVHARLDRPPRWGDPVAAETFHLFYQAVELLLRKGCSVVAEAAFVRGVSEAEVIPFLELADARLIHCHTATDLAQRRFTDRASRDATRRYAHPDDEIIARMQAGTFDWTKYEPLDLGIASLIVTTSAGYSPPIDDVAAFSRE